jgi:hypothetical protein
MRTFYSSVSQITIVDIKSGREAWKKLISEYKKDSATTRMALHQQFYSLTHDPAVGIAVFIDAIFSTVRQLSAIGHKPDDLKISNKLLIGLPQSWAPVRTALTLHEKPEKPEINWSPLRSSNSKRTNRSWLRLDRRSRLSNPSQALLSRLCT